jgi:hypothetical protein
MADTFTSNVKIPRAVCAAVADILNGSHAALEILFRACGAPEGPAPALSHGTKWKTWLFQIGNDPSVDSLTFLGNLLEEFMDLSPTENVDDIERWKKQKSHLVSILEEHGFRYYRGGRILPVGTQTSTVLGSTMVVKENEVLVDKPSSVEEVLCTLIRGLPRAMHPLTHRRKDIPVLAFSSEYDVQDLLHALLRPWIADIRPEEFTPSYAGSSTRMDFLLPVHGIVIEMKFVRNQSHGRKIGAELIIDIEHYRRHPNCKTLWCVIYDPNSFIQNQEGLKKDLEGIRSSSDGKVGVSVFIF